MVKFGLSNYIITKIDFYCTCVNNYVAMRNKGTQCRDYRLIILKFSC